MVMNGVANGDIVYTDWQLASVPGDLEGASVISQPQLGAPTYEPLAGPVVFNAGDSTGVAVAGAGMSLEEAFEGTRWWSPEEIASREGKVSLAKPSSDRIVILIIVAVGLYFLFK